jgi:adenosylcobinamide-GDP ribazoletransferase
MSGLLLAAGFLTILPVGGRAYAPGSLGRASRWFPVIGSALGAALALVAGLLAGRLQPLLTAALVVTLWATFTGGLHLDGLADCCDGLLPPGLGSRERRLEIMSDPRLGSFGGIGLCLFLVLKILAVSALISNQGSGVRGYTAPFTFYVSRFTNYELRITDYALLLSPVIARWLILPVATQPSARPGGRGAEFALGLTGAGFALAALLPLALILLGGWPAALAAGLAHLAALIIVWLARTRLGGVTGDTLGFTVEAAELTCLLAYAFISNP